ncbi:unnamed protein product [Cuscuta campestris]|uniref:Uncharacterized protein n=1 Tax=Cuscuta campestris TaxID=132261 RepID=A0A484KSB9_9ASTE|nr:unnamed protein product [Cuscuta campestris]
MDYNSWAIRIVSIINPRFPDSWRCVSIVQISRKKGHFSPTGRAEPAIVWKIILQRIINVGKDRETKVEVTSQKRLTFDESDAEHEKVVHVPPREETSLQNSAKKPKKQMHFC